MDNKLWKVLLMIWLIFFTTALVIGWQDNQNRIRDIQQSRKTSCEQTYEGIRRVFQPFFPKHPTKQQQFNRIKFDSTIQQLINRCASQTKSNK